MRPLSILVFGLLFAGPLHAQVTITTASPLPGGTAGAAYSQTLTTVPGCTLVCTWTITSGSLPSGLTLNASTGEIAGTPIAAVDTTFSIEFNDTTLGIATATLTLTIAPPPAITTASLPAGTSGTAYAQTLASSGGTAPLTWSITAGSLPNGLSLTAATGAISGTTSAAGTFNFTAGVSDAVGATTTRALSITINATLAITTASLPAGTSGTAYAQILASSGGTAPLTWSITAGSLPTGLSLTAATGAISGTPSASGTFNFTAGAADAVGGTATQALSITINATLAVTTASLPAGTSGTAYAQTLASSGGTAPLTWSITAGSLPTGLSLTAATGAISGTPSAAGTFNFTAGAADAVGGTATQALSITINATLAITTASLPAGTSGTAYAQTLASSGGTAPLTWSITAGSLPTGLSLTAATGAISGTPSAAGTFNFTAGAADAVGGTATQALSITINATLAITTASLPAGTSGTAYAQTLASSGGTAPLTWSITAGSLPNGLSLTAATGAISGTPSAAGTFNFTAGVSDAVGATTTRALSITINATLAITTTSLPAGTSGTAYAQTLASSGGTAPLTWSITAGSLPNGLSLAAATGAISGTPSAAGTFNFTAGAADAVGGTATQALSITINATLAITTTSLPAGTSGTAYAQTLASSGGTAPLTWSITAGSLPTGLSLTAATGAISGTPSAAGTFNFTAGAADAVGGTATQALSITINATLAITTTSLPAGTSGTAYAQTLASSGGTAPLTWSITAGSLPTGLSLTAATGAISGTPSAAGTFNFTADIADNAGAVATQALSVVVNPTVAIVTPSLPGGTQDTAYSTSITKTGGTSPFTWSIVVGSLPAGLSLTAATGAISGTPSAAGTFDFTVSVVDAVGSTDSRALSIGIAAPPNITTTSLPGGISGVTYSVALSGTGGTAPLDWAITVGALPAGLSLDGATGTIVGAPSTTGTFGFTVRVTDAAGATDTQAFSITVALPLGITTTVLPRGTAGTPYSTPLAATGGITPYTWSVTTGSLPGGLTLDANSGVISGTPNTVGTANFLVRAVDSGNPAQTVDQPLSIAIVPTLSITTTSPLQGGMAGVAYSQTLTATGGTAPYSWAVTVGDLPGGLSLAASTGVISGTASVIGTFNFTIQVSDSGASLPPSVAFTLVIDPVPVVIPPLTISNSGTLTPGTLGMEYSQSLNATGGILPYTWSLIGGAIPAGLTLAPGGVLNGTPTVAGTFSFAVRVTDSSGAAQTDTRSLSLTIVPALAILTASLPPATVGIFYSATLVPAGGTLPYVWSITSGSLPSGLSLNPSTGIISGTPVAPTVSIVGITLTDTNQPPPRLTKSQTYALTVRLPEIDTSLSGSLQPAQQTPLTMALRSPIASALSGQLTLSFAPSGAFAVDDPMVQFSNGQRTVAFTIEPNSLAAVFSSPLQLLTGTVSGSITLTVNFQGGPTNLQVGTEVQVPQEAPQISSVTATQSATTMTVRVIGYSTPRSVTDVAFRFDVRTASGVQQVDLARSVNPEFASWYESPQSITFGSAFVLSQIFNVQSNGATVEAVTVTLTNAQGSSSSSRTLVTPQ